MDDDAAAATTTTTSVATDDADLSRRHRVQPAWRGPSIKQVRRRDRASDEDDDDAARRSARDQCVISLNDARQIQSSPFRCLCSSAPCGRPIRPRVRNCHHDRSSHEISDELQSLVISYTKQLFCILRHQYSMPHLYLATGRVRPLLIRAMMSGGCDDLAPILWEANCPK